MAYNIKSILNDGITIVYGLTDSQIADIEQKVYRDNPEYRVQLAEIFKNFKLGPFKFENKKTIAELILRYSKTPKADGSDFLNNFVFRHAKALECDKLMDRFPKNLSQGQLLRVSLIADAIDKKMKYLYTDYPDYNNIANMELRFLMFNWFDSYAEYDLYEYKVIWLTHVPELELLAGLKNARSFRENVKLYTVENGELVNKTGLIKNMLKEYRAKVNAVETAQNQKPAENQKSDTELSQRPLWDDEPQDEAVDIIATIEALIYECSQVPLAPHRLEGLLELLQEAGSVEYYEQLIEVIKMYLMKLQEYRGESDIIYEDALETCEKEREKLLSGAATAEANPAGKISEEDYIAQQKQIISQLYSDAKAAEGINDAVALENYLKMFENKYVTDEFKAAVCEKIAEFYEFGRGTARNIKEAQKWYEKSINLGGKDVVVSFKAASMLFDEYETRFDEEKANMLSSDEYAGYTEKEIYGFAAELTAKKLYWNRQFYYIVNIFEKYGAHQKIDDAGKYTREIIRYWMEQSDIEQSMQYEYSDEEIKAALDKHRKENALADLYLIMFKRLEAIAEEEREKNSR